MVGSLGSPFSGLPGLGSSTPLFTLPQLTSLAAAGTALSTVPPTTTLSDILDFLNAESSLSNSGGLAAFVSNLKPLAFSSSLPIIITNLPSLATFISNPASFIASNLPSPLPNITSNPSVFSAANIKALGGFLGNPSGFISGVVSGLIPSILPPPINSTSNLSTLATWLRSPANISSIIGAPASAISNIVTFGSESMQTLANIVSLGTLSSGGFSGTSPQSPITSLVTFTQNLPTTLSNLLSIGVLNPTYLSNLISVGSLSNQTLANLVGLGTLSSSGFNGVSPQGPISNIVNLATGPTSFVSGLFPNSSAYSGGTTPQQLIKDAFSKPLSVPSDVLNMMSVAQLPSLPTLSGFNTNFGLFSYMSNLFSNLLTVGNELFIGLGSSLPNVIGVHTGSFNGSDAVYQNSSGYSTTIAPPNWSSQPLPGNLGYVTQLSAAAGGSMYNFFNRDLNGLLNFMGNPVSGATDAVEGVVYLIQALKFGLHALMELTVTTGQLASSVMNISNVLGIKQSFANGQYIPISSGDFKNQLWYTLPVGPGTNF